MNRLLLSSRTPKMGLHDSKSMDKPFTHPSLRRCTASSSSRSTALVEDAEELEGAKNARMDLGSEEIGDDDEDFEMSSWLSARPQCSCLSDTPVSVMPISDVLEKGWAELPPCLLRSISDKLALRDFMSFRHVCPSWRLAPSDRTDITKFSKSEPWLMIYSLEDDKSSNCYLYDGSGRNFCIVSIPDLRGSTCHYSKLGWLLVQRGDEFFFYNPLSFNKIDLPNFLDMKDDALCVFLSVPTSKECIVFIVQPDSHSKVKVSSCRIGDTKWEKKQLDTGRVSIGKMMCIVMCPCSGFRTCHCENKSTLTVFSVCGKKVMLYDFVTGEVSVHDTRFIKAGDTLFKEMQKVHQEGWFFLAGAKDYSVSVCHSLMKEGCLPMHQLTCTVTSGIETSKPKSMRASWLEPCFDDL